MLTSLTDLLGETAMENDVTNLVGMLSEISAAVRAKASDQFKALGLELKTFLIANLRPSEESIQELRNMGVLDMDTYTRLQAADALLEAAQNPSGGAGLTAGIGAGMGVGNLLSQTLQGSAGGAAAGGPAMPDVMSPAEAAQFLKVSEEDVLAALKAGDLKGKKLGKAYRISKDALLAFLNE